MMDMDPGQVFMMLTHAMGATMAIVTALHAFLKVVFRHTDFLSEEQENGILNFISKVLGMFSLFNSGKRNP